jgi:membrane protein
MRSYLQARLFRVLLITGKTYRQTRASSRAAALSFSSLLGIGPLTTLIVILGTPLLGRRDSRMGAKALSHVLQFIAPQIHEYEQLTDTGASAATGHAFNPKLVEIIDSFVAGAHRGSAGTFGALSLALIVFLLFRSIENSFNEIWQVKSGRSVFHSIGFHLVLFGCGGVLFFAAAAMLSAGAFINVFIAKLSFGKGLLPFLRWGVTGVSFALLTGLLAAGYRLIPNTKVRWSSSLTGALVVAGLLLINNFVAFLYLRRVIMTRSLYGSLGMVPVLMLGLYIFWLFVLIGGQISYAVQKTNRLPHPDPVPTSTLPPDHPNLA